MGGQRQPLRHYSPEAPFVLAEAEWLSKVDGRLSHPWESQPDERERAHGSPYVTRKKRRAFNYAQRRRHRKIRKEKDEGSKCLTLKTLV